MDRLKIAALSSGRKPPKLEIESELYELSKDTRNWFRIKLNDALITNKIEPQLEINTLKVSAIENLEQSVEYEGEFVINKTFNFIDKAEQIFQKRQKEQMVFTRSFTQEFESVYDSIFSAIDTIESHFKSMANKFPDKPTLIEAFELNADAIATQVLVERKILKQLKNEIDRPKLNFEHEMSYKTNISVCRYPMGESIYIEISPMVIFKESRPKILVEVDGKSLLERTYGDQIKIPTSEIGSHQVIVWHIQDDMIKDSLVYNYEVIE
ncbi:hypothetical protein K6119_13080 [Paracrocinitomix mangrovi]|uniref:hypothetical protein n=1 Tax=Paracrocinitomix mangrovi TaxID=2862509 RepID=UPI001C8E42AB|nr:hypothetical protein [Paracrocinitomix mangrovi]UKN00663.1 hypothetical protein K6119_13080 [Paracrocinitomix mangrovi]